VTTILHITDTHGGLFGGLIEPGTELTYDNGEKHTPELSSLSQWVNECYHKLITTTIDYAESDPVVVIHTAEVCHGSRFSEFLYTPWPDHQVAIAVRSLTELRQIPTLSGFCFAYGSQAHDWGQQSATKQVAEQVAAWGYPVECVDMGRVEIDGALVDFAHKGPMTSKTEDVASVGRKYTIRLARSYLERGKRAPDIVLRGHIHRRVTDLVKVPWGRDGVSVLLSVGAPLTAGNEFALNFTHALPFTEVGGTLIKIDRGRVVDWQIVTWERENRQHLDGVRFYHFNGGMDAHPPVV
jgi:hypothetical protein